MHRSFFPSPSEITHLKLGLVPVSCSSGLAFLSWYHSVSQVQEMQGQSLGEEVRHLVLVALWPYVKPSVGVSI